MNFREICFFILCCSSLTILAQSDDQTNSNLFDKEQELKALVKLEKPTKEDEVQMFVLCRELGKGYTHKAAAFEGQEIKRRYALEKALHFHDLEAKFYYEFGVKHKTKYFKTTLKEKACGEAAFVYRDLGKPDRIHVPGWTFENFCGLVNPDDEPQNDVSVEASATATQQGPEYIDEEFEKTLKGERLYFETPVQTFSINLYAPFGISDQSAIMRDLMKKKYGELISSSVLGEQESDVLDQLDRMHFYMFTGNLGGLFFHVEDLGEKEGKMFCDEENSQLSRWTSVSGVRACISNIYQHPITKERLNGGTTMVQFVYKNNMVSLLLLAGKGFNKSKHETILKAMARSLSIEGEVELPKIVVKRCKDSTTLQLKKGIPVEYTIIDRSRKTVILYQPALARATNVASSASKFYGAILQTMKWSKDVKQVLNIYNNVMIEKEYREALLKAGGWFLEDAGTVQIDFVPVEVEDYSEFTVDGSLTNAAIFYMDALTRITSGLSRLGKSMNKQSMRVYWEIPVIKIRGECIPQMVCVDGKWKKDLLNMEYREISWERDELRPDNKDFQTFADIQRDLNRYFYTNLEQVENTEAAYSKVKQRCINCREQLTRIKFPLKIDECPVLEQQIQQEQFAKLEKQNEQKVLKFELDRWLNSLKPAEYLKSKGRISLLNDQIRIEEDKLPSLRNLRDAHLKNGDKTSAAVYAKKIKFLEEDITLLIDLRKTAQQNLDFINSGKREKDLSGQLSAVSKQINIHKDKIKSLEVQLKKCVDEALKVR